MDSARKEYLFAAIVLASILILDDSVDGYCTAAALRTSIAVGCRSQKY
jgi:hypothetical protein